MQQELTYFIKTPIDSFQETPDRRHRAERVAPKSVHKDNRASSRRDDKFKSYRKHQEEKTPKSKTKKRLTFNIYNTNYPVVDLAAKNLGFKTVSRDHNLVPNAELRQAHKVAFGPYAAIQPEEFDLVWFDLTINNDVLSKLKPHQRVS